MKKWLLASGLMEFVLGSVFILFVVNQAVDEKNPVYGAAGVILWCASIISIFLAIFISLFDTSRKVENQSPAQTHSSQNTSPTLLRGRWRVRLGYLWLALIIPSLGISFIESLSTIDTSAGTGFYGSLWILDFILGWSPLIFIVGSTASLTKKDFKSPPLIKALTLIPLIPLVLIIYPLYVLIMLVVLPNL